MKPLRQRQNDANPLVAWAARLLDETAPRPAAPEARARVRAALQRRRRRPRMVLRPLPVAVLLVLCMTAAASARYGRAAGARVAAMVRALVGARPHAGEGRRAEAAGPPASGMTMTAPTLAAAALPPLPAAPSPSVQLPPVPSSPSAIRPMPTLSAAAAPTQTRLAPTLSLQTAPAHLPSQQTSSAHLPPQNAPAQDPPAPSPTTAAIQEAPALASRASPAAATAAPPGFDDEPTPDQAAPAPPASAPPVATGPRPADSVDAALVADGYRLLRVDHDYAAAAARLDAYLRLPGDAPLVEDALALRIEAAAKLGDGSAAGFARRYLTRFPAGRFAKLAQAVLDRRAR